MFILKHLKTLQHVSIIIQIIFRELVNSRAQKTAGKFLASIFELKTASSSLIIFERAELSTRSITRLCWCN